MEIKPNKTEGQPNMNNEINGNLIQEIHRLHDDLIATARQSVTKAVRIGELLAGQKKSLKHGEWLGWCKAHLSFTDRTARNYLRLYDNRLKLETVSDLTTAYQMLAAPDVVVPMERDEAEASIAAAKAHLHDVADYLVRLESVEAERTWEGEYNTFEEFLTGAGVSMQEYRKLQELFSSIVSGERDWMAQFANGDLKP